MLKFILIILPIPVILLSLHRVQCRTPQNLVIMKEKNFCLNEQEISLILFALTTYVLTLEKIGLGLDSMPTVASLIEQFSKND